MDESENVEILDSGTVEGPVAAALVDGEDADIGKLQQQSIFNI